MTIILFLPFFVVNYAYLKIMKKFGLITIKLSSALYVLFLAISFYYFYISIIISIIDKINNFLYEIPYHIMGFKGFLEIFFCDLIVFIPLIIFSNYIFGVKGKSKMWVTLYIVFYFIQIFILVEYFIYPYSRWIYSKVL